MSSESGPSNVELIRRLFGLAWRYRMRCVQVLGIQLVLLTMGLFGLSFTGIGIDYIRQVISRDPGRRPPGRDPVSAFQPPLGMASHACACRPRRPHPPAVGPAGGPRLRLRRPGQPPRSEDLVVDLRSEIYDKLQRLSFRFFDANTTGSIITRVTGDVQSVRMLGGFCRSRCL